MKSAKAMVSITQAQHDAATAMVGRIGQAMAEAEANAWACLGKYKFLLFGYWAARWVTLNKMLGEHNPNPFRKLVQFAASEVANKHLQAPVGPEETE